MQESNPKIFHMETNKPNYISNEKNEFKKVLNMIL
jgi:hypothetical protein